jgi:hypothetical protein
MLTASIIRAQHPKRHLHTRRRENLKFRLMTKFVCGLFNDAISSSHYTASNDRMINEWRIGKDMEGSGRGLTGRPWKTGRDSRSPSRDLNFRNRSRSDNQLNNQILGCSVTQIVGRNTSNVAVTNSSACQSHSAWNSEILRITSQHSSVFIYIGGS